MFNNLLFIPLIFMALTTLGMQVPQASQVRIRTAIKNNEMVIPIKDNTTVLGVKELLQEHEGIPVNQQAIHAVSPRPWTLGLIKDTSDCAMNDVHLMKDVIREYNTDLFTLYLSLRKRQE